jgi:hypothetical protein
VLRLERVDLCQVRTGLFAIDPDVEDLPGQDAPGGQWVTAFEVEHPLEQAGEAIVRSLGVALVQYREKVEFSPLRRLVGILEQAGRPISSRPSPS